MKKNKPPPAAIFDVLYGFVPITPWEEEIINSPFFQRLRWIKQLGFANYIFPGAEHNRFAHVIGVMHSMEQMLKALGLAVPQSELFDPKAHSKAAMLHKSLRIAALLHDLGTFPFSHSVEFGYIRHGNRRGTESTQVRAAPDGKTKSVKALANNHEHLGAFIIKNTRYPGGITEILERYGFDVQRISNIIKGDSPDLIANQLMHSDLDADRMDYLLRDAHYTGIQYGKFDREYILSNLQTFSLPGGQLGFGVRESASHAVEDFLIARFSWYSQIIKNQASAKFDIIASHLSQVFLENDLMVSFHDLLEMIEKRDERFFWWNDVYFINRLQEIRAKKLIKDPAVQQKIEMLLYRKAPKTVRDPLFEHRIMLENPGARKKTVQALQKRVEFFKTVIRKYGGPGQWLLADIPEKDVSFTRRPEKNPLRQRDPVKIISRSGKVSLLADSRDTLMTHLSKLVHFIPSVYANRPALETLKKRKLISE